MKEDIGAIALLGGSGFIGTRLASRLLEADRRIRIIDIAPSRALSASTGWLGTCETGGPFYPPWRAVR